MSVDIDAKSILDSQKRDMTAYVERCKAENCKHGNNDQPWGYHGSTHIDFYRKHIQAKHAPEFCLEPETLHFADWSGVYTT